MNNNHLSHPHDKWKNKCQHWNISDNWYQNKDSIELETPSVSDKRGSLDGYFSLARIPLQTCLEKEWKMFCVYHCNFDICFNNSVGGRSNPNYFRECQTGWQILLIVAIF